MRNFQVSYAIGIAEPMAVYVNSYGTGKYTNKQLHDIVVHNFDLRPGILMRWVVFLSNAVRLF